MRRAEAEGRLSTPVPYLRQLPVSTFWDLGKRDFTAIWFVQLVNFDYRFIDYYENQGFDVDHYAQEVQKRPYTYDDHWLPHDAKRRVLEAKYTVEEQLRNKKFHTRMIPKGRVFNGITAARMIFPNCHFDPVKCSRGIQTLQHYQFEVIDGQFSVNPLHNWASHGADAFRGVSVGLKPDNPGEALSMKEKIKKMLNRRTLKDTGDGTGWMR